MGTAFLPGPSSALYAQAISGDIVGTVTDATGAAVPNAAITATNRATGVKTQTASQGNGEYRFSNLPPGLYDLSASAAGFTASILKGVNVNANTTGTANLSMQVGSVSTTVEVSEATVMLDTTTAQIQNTYNTLATSDLPNASIGQGVLNLSLLQAGVSSAGGVGVGSGPSIGGQRPRNNNFMVDGVDNNSKSVTGPSLFVPNDAVQEFTLLQNQFQAEYGHSSGGQFNTLVRSGTNEFHFLLYDYLQNRNLNAVDQQLKNQGTLSNPRYDSNRLGGQMGGHIKRDKLFYFANFEYNPTGQASTSGTVYAPTAAAYSALANIAGISKTNLAILQQYAVGSLPAANAPTITIPNPVAGGAPLAVVPTAQIPIVAPNFRNSYFGVFSMDYNISNTDQLRGRFVYNRQSAINTGATLPVFYTAVPFTGYLATLAEYHTFSPHITNEFRANFQRSNSTSPVGSQTYPGLDVFPNLQFNDLQLQVGPNPNFPQASIVNLYQGVDAVSWIRGSHTFKFGTEFRKYISPQQFSQRLRGDYEYTTVANFLLDQIPDFLAQRNVGNPIYYGDQIASYSFAQDTWRIRRNLTLDLGLRYEYTTVPVGIRAEQLNALSSVPGLITFKAPTPSSTGFAPRIGFAYTPDQSGNTVVRGGFGLAYDVLFDNLGLNAVPPQFATTVNASTPAFPAVGFLAAGGITQASGGSTQSPAAARAATSSYLPDQKLPYSINYNLSVQHLFAKDYTLEVRYLGTKGVHQVMQTQINRQSLVSATNNIPTFYSTPSAATLAALPTTVGNLRATVNGLAANLVPAYANAGFTSTITAYEPLGYSEYNGLAVQLNKRFAHGLQYQAAYTWSHLIDNSTAEVASTYLTPRRAQDFQNLTPEKASSALDRRHRATLSLVYEPTIYKGSSNWILKNLVGNWVISPIYTYESPEYFTPQSGVDANLNGDAAPDRTIINPGGTAGTGSRVIGYDRNGNQIAPTASTALVNTVVAWVAVNPNARYIQAGPGAYANGGRNTEAVRPIDNIDLSLFKKFNFSEKHASLQVGAQAFNLFNHAQFIPGSLNNIAPVGTFTTGGQALVTASNTNFNNPTNSFSSQPRAMQIVAKFTW